MSILVFGSMNIDKTFYLPHWIRCGETLQSSRLTIHAGGKGANQAVALAKAGADVSIAGTIGTDGHWVRQRLEAYGVNTELVRESEHITTGTADILVDEQGKNGIVLYGGGNQANDKEYIDSVFTHFGTEDWVVFENEINNLPYLYGKAIDAGIWICLNASPMDPSLLELPLKQTAILVVNEIEGASLAGITGTFSEILEALVVKYPGTEIVLTVGKDGSIYGYKEERFSCPIVPTTVKDTTAAGDTFLGYFLAMRERGRGAREAMDIATKASSITVSRCGSMDSIPEMAEL